MSYTKKALTLVFLFSTTFFGFSMLSYENDLISNSLLPCCNNGVCHSLSCSSSSGLLTVSGETTITCQECIDLVGEGAIYNYLGPDPSYCQLSNCPYCGQARYYWSNSGNTHTCQSTITIDATSPLSQAGYVYSVDGNSYPGSGGTFQATNGTQHTLYASNAIRGCFDNRYFFFYRWNDGNTSYSRTITVNGNATYFAMYRDKNGNECD